jgi:hypothetical protein|tara:strand:+ start:1835 stop:2605 length:771 start_codon:yes stop_codon:yes gene_type:complete
MKITKSELREIIQEVADELGLFEGLTAAQEKLPEPLKKAILKKQGKSDDSDDEKKDVEEGLTKAQEKLPEPLKKAILKKQGKQEESDEDSEEEKIEEGNAFGAAVKKARENGEKEFEVGGKKYKLKEKKEITEQEDTEEFVGDSSDEEDVEEGNAFGAAVKKAREDGEDEFEVDGKTYKVTEQSDSSDIGKKDNHVDVADCKDCDDPGEGKLTSEDVDESITEIEVDGKTYKVGQNWSKITLAEKLDRMLGNRKIL